MCKYFKIYGIPFLTLVTLKLDSNLKIIDFRADKSNIKQAFLSDENGANFPWKNETLKSTNETTISLKKPIIKSTELSSESAKKTNAECFDDYDREFLNEIISNLSSINEKNEQTVVNSNAFEFLFILFGSSQSEVNSIVIQNLAEFWQKFHLKHKFIVVYLNYDDVPLENMPFWYTILNTNMKVNILLNIKLIKLYIQ